MADVIVGRDLRRAEEDHRGERLDALLEEVRVRAILELHGIEEGLRDGVTEARVRRGGQRGVVGEVLDVDLARDPLQVLEGRLLERGIEPGEVVLVRGRRVRRRGRRTGDRRGESQDGGDGEEEALE